MSTEGPQPFIRIDTVTKKFGTFTAVDAVSLDIQKGEMFALLGGSGCGKTTLLRMLAGFEEPTSGRIFIDGQDMTGVPPYERPVNMMFQSYALFPHMSVEQNVGYGLKHEGLTATARRSRVAEMLDLVQLKGYESRKPHQLSGGQRQRVALARALAKQLLLDEPLGALDKKLREHTQFEIMNIQSRTGITFVVVTHDQEEAMTLADRIAVMDKGVIRQTGSPNEIYEYPNSRFVAGFIGAMNMFEGQVTESAQGLAVGVEALGGHLVLAPGSAAPGETVAVAVRPEKISLSRDRAVVPNTFQGQVKELGYFGKDSLYRIVMPSGAVISVNSVNTRRSQHGRAFDWDDKVWLAIDPSSVIVLRS